MTTNSLKEMSTDMFSDITHAVGSYISWCYEMDGKSQAAGNSDDYWVRRAKETQTSLNELRRIRHA